MGDRAETTELPRPESWLHRPLPDEAPTEALVLLWSREEPARVGEVVFFAADEEGPWMLGRGEPEDDPRLRATFVRQRPGRSEPQPPLTCPWLSRTQLVIARVAPGTLLVENVGRCPLRIRGADVAEGRVEAGDLVELRGEMLFLCLRRPLRMRVIPGHTVQSHPFGLPDALGLVGESPASWALRSGIAVAARTDDHVLVLGASGSGKELVAQAIHALSPAGKKAMVSRNAATIPTGIVAAELFGNLKGYPNPGTPERPGLVGAAHGSTLFLDEIADLPIDAQTGLLRVLDQGEYQRLGDETVRRSKVRFVGATNRPTSQLRDDVRRRFKRTIEVPGLNDRREDIPQLVTHLLRHRAATSDPGLAGRFFERRGELSFPRVTPDLVAALVAHDYATNVRELEALLIVAVDGSRGDYVELTDDLRSKLGEGAPAPGPGLASMDEPGFDEPHRARLEVLRRNAFSPTRCELDTTRVKANRPNWDLYYRQLIWRALVLDAMSMPEAATRLAGAGDGDLRQRVLRRLEEHVSRLARDPSAAERASPGNGDLAAVLAAIRDGTLAPPT